jgi:hypothetical protein
LKTFTSSLKKYYNINKSKSKSNQKMQNIQNKAYMELFYKKIASTNNQWSLMKLEKEIEHYIEKYGDELYDNGTIEIILDTRDAIITQISKIRRDELMRSYLERRTNNKTEPTNKFQDPTYYYEYLLTKKSQLEEDLSKVNEELQNIQQQQQQKQQEEEH